MRRARKTIANDMFGLMIYMIGFNPEEKFEMVMADMLADDKEYPSYLDWTIKDMKKLASWCDERWGTGIESMLEKMEAAA
tara:strand:+ start:190 stop:429 length:240 start_codon:yes stop_codon:yes gene_type:complete